MKQEKFKSQNTNPFDETQEFEMLEALRGLRTNIMFSMNQRKHKRIIYTSAVPMEGKTSTSIDFSIILARTGLKVVLIDADMRKPNVHKVLGIGKSKRGLSNALNDGCFENVLLQCRPYPIRAHGLGKEL